MKLVTCLSTNGFTALAQKPVGPSPSFCARTKQVIIVAFLIVPTSIVVSGQTVTYLQKSALPIHQKSILRAIGNRMEVPGKERQTITGSLQLFAGGNPSSNSTVSVIYQLPGLLRLQDVSNNRAVVFNGNQTLITSGTPLPQDMDTVESLVYDSIEGFMCGQLYQQYNFIAHWYGPAFRIIDKRPANALSGTCSLYEFNQQVRARTAQSQNVKKFCFDSGSQLLKNVSYNLNGSYVETRFGNWMMVGDQVVPGQVQRFVNGVPSFTLTVGAVAFSAAVADSLLTTP